MFEKFRLGRVMKKMAGLEYGSDEYLRLQDKQAGLLARMAAIRARKRAKKKFKKGS